MRLPLAGPTNLLDRRSRRLALSVAGLECSFLEAAGDLAETVDPANDTDNQDHGPAAKSRSSRMGSSGQRPEGLPAAPPARLTGISLPT